MLMMPPFFSGVGGVTASGGGVVECGGVALLLLEMMGVVILKWLGSFTKSRSEVKPFVGVVRFPCVP